MRLFLKLWWMRLILKLWWMRLILNYGGCAALCIINTIKVVYNRLSCSGPYWTIS